MKIQKYMNKQNNYIIIIKQATVKNNFKHSLDIKVKIKHKEKHQLHMIKKNLLKKNQNVKK